MKIIRCKEEHISKLTPLFDAYRQFYKQASNFAGADNFLRERIRNNESVVFMALDDKEIALGFTQLYPIFSSVSIQRAWLLNDLYVAENARRKGVAEALMESARQLAKETHAKGISLETGVDNPQAQALYEKLGYEKEQSSYFYFLKT